MKNFLAGVSRRRPYDGPWKCPECGETKRSHFYWLETIRRDYNTGPKRLTVTVCGDCLVKIATSLLDLMDNS
jgi:4-hydroxy-3-methylbut-2-en-1-yl diphosphate synthase IspG/GcpE